ncbi:MAG: DUF1549 and DUF1553 domain-containing protein [Planctomycetota bacterium]
MRAGNRTRSSLIVPFGSRDSAVATCWALVIPAAALLLGFNAAIGASATFGQNWEVSPATILIDRPESSQQVLVTQVQGTQRRDATRDAKFSVSSPAVARVDATGRVTPVGDGATELVVELAGATRRVPLTVAKFTEHVPVSFAHEVIPVLTKSRCNSGGCHGKAEGQAGFKLSLFGFDAAADYEAIVRAGRGRRIMLASPERSLLLAKGAAQVPHGGGLKLEEGSPGHRRLVRWLAAGAPREAVDERPVVAIEVEPREVVIAAEGSQQLRVTAIDAKGERRCVTAESDFVSNAPFVADVDAGGLVRASDVPGDTAVLVRYQGHVAVARFVLPRPAVAATRPAERNFIDRLVWDKLAKMGLPPSPVADDSTFLRRVYLDVTGTLPTGDEARRFLDDQAPNKRERLISELLDRPEYASYWAMKWSNLLRADKVKVTPQATVGLTRWLRRQFATNRPYDQMVRDILTAQGPIQNESPAAFFKAVDQPELASRSVSQLFLGVRIECAQCHHHPSERWGQDDYAGLVGFFTGVATKKLPEGGEAIIAKTGTDAKHPRSGELVPARVLGGTAADFTGERDRRRVLATWATAQDNPFFAKAIANRLWAHYFGRGLVEPIDDLRDTNPATNEPLLAALEAHLKEVRFDLKAFTRTLLSSSVYQLSSETTTGNQDDRQHFSHASPKSLPAEVLLDAVCQTTGVPEKFNGWPLGVRAVDVWDNRMPSYFFRIFGRPVRATVCECERSNEPSIAQALHLMNSPEINAKITHRSGLARQWAESPRTPDQLIEEVYLAVLARRPRPSELEIARQAFAFPPAQAETETGSGTLDESRLRREAVEDILWTLLNSKEFLYVH